MQAWNEFLQTLEQRFGKPTIDRWVRPLKIIKFDARNLYLEAPDPLQMAWFEEQIRPDLKTQFCNNNNLPIAIHFIQTKDTSSKPPLQTPFHIHPNRLDPELSFAHFIRSIDNQMALEICQNPTFNPIYISGPKASGKTHLLTATALKLQAQGKKVFYVRAETFTSHVVQAIRLGCMRQFREVYRSIDVLLIDDIDFLAQKNATQEEFFHTFNTLHMSNQQIVISANVPPSQLLQIEPRLMSRFEWGISLKIAPPAPLELLELKASLWKFPYSKELLSFLAETFPKDPLMAMQALALRAKGPVTPKSALSLLQDLISQEKTEQLTPETIIAKTALHFGIKVEDILGKSQTKEHVTPRQVAMYLCRDALGLPFQKIGAIFGRDHSTVMSSVRGAKEGASFEAIQQIARALSLKS